MRSTSWCSLLHHLSCLSMSSCCWPLTPDRPKTKPPLKLPGGWRTQFSGMVVNTWTPCTALKGPSGVAMLFVQVISRRRCNMSTSSPPPSPLVCPQTCCTGAGPGPREKVLGAAPSPPTSQAPQLQPLQTNLQEFCCDALIVRRLSGAVLTQLRPNWVIEERKTHTTTGEHLFSAPPGARWVEATRVICEEAKERATHTRRWKPSPKRIE